jgi:hypothetical protein
MMKSLLEDLMPVSYKDLKDKSYLKSTKSFLESHLGIRFISGIDPDVHSMTTITRHSRSVSAKQVKFDFIALGPAKETGTFTT